MKRVIGTKHSLILAAVMAASGLFAADVPPAVSPTNEADIKTVVDTIQSLSGLLQNLDATANGLAETEDAKSAPAKDGKVDKEGRPLKNTIAIITAGAAAGASIGAATKKGTQAIVIGAIAGAAAGLIYDRVIAEKKAPPQPDATSAPAPAAETAKPEITKPSGKLVPAPTV